MASTAPPGSIRARVLKEGFFRIDDALLPEGKDYLVAQSQAELAKVIYEARGWGERYAAPSARLLKKPVFTNEFEAAMTAICGRGTKQLGNIDCPQYAFCRPVEGDWGFDTHIDGAAADREVNAGRYEVLIAILLNDVRGEDDGAFVIWPRSHLDVFENLRGRPRQYLRTAIHDCIPDLLSKRAPALTAPPMPFVGSAGTAIICHHLLVHGTAPRRRPGVRHMAFFRPAYAAYEKDALVEATTFARL